MQDRVILGATEEKKLAFWISQFDDQVYAASMLLLPNAITEYIYNLAKKFHSFYEACRILGSDRDVELSRLQVRGRGRKGEGGGKRHFFFPHNSLFV